MNKSDAQNLRNTIKGNCDWTDDCRIMVLFEYNQDDIASVNLHILDNATGDKYIVSYFHTCDETDRSMYQSIRFKRADEHDFDGIVLPNDIANLSAMVYSLLDAKIHDNIDGLLSNAEIQALQGASTERRI